MSVDILQFLRQNGVDEANESDCHSLIKYFTGNKNSMGYEDFLSVVMPCDNQNLRAEIA